MPDSIETIETAPGEYYYYYYYDDEPEDTNSTTAYLKRLRQSFAAQSMRSNMHHSRTITNTASITTTNSGGMDAEELKQLIYTEMLKESYNELLQQYNQMQERQFLADEAYTFDPADPNERFTVVVIGDDLTKMWTRTFSLNGTTRYQSYNSSVWYLGYQIPIYKKDVRDLYNIFESSKNVKYMVHGSGGTATFQLSDYYIKGMRELLYLYASGKLLQQQSTTFPMLR